MQKTIMGFLVLLQSLMIAAPARTDLTVRPPLFNAAGDTRSMTSGIQESIDALPPGGGTVFLPAGVYHLKTSIELRSHVRLIGEGPSTVLRPVDETKSALEQDAAGGQNQVVVVSATGFETGMAVIVKNDDLNVGWLPNLRTITAINGNTITLDTDLSLTIDKEPNGIVVNAFPVIKADAYHNGTIYTDILIENIKIDGNKANVGEYTFQQAGISLIRTVRSTVRNVWIDQSNYEGVSDQGLGDTWNTFSHNLITNCAGKGIHLGTTCRHFTISGNRILNNGGDGIYFCNDIQYGLLSDNIISGNGRCGIGAIDHSGADGDNDNVIEGNVITLNGRHGIEAEGSARNSIINNLIAENSQNSPGSFSGLYLDGVTGFLVSGNRILRNTGPGISCSDSDLTLFNDLISANEAGGLVISDSTAEMISNTIAGNTNQPPGGGVYCNDSMLTITNTILWGNTPDQLYLESGVVPTVSYSNVQNGFSGPGNISEDPLFTSGPLGEYYLGQTAAGQPSDSTCVDAGRDPAGSTCFTIADETTCLDQLTSSTCHAPDAGMVDMGFHHDAGRYSTLSAELACWPAAGTLPFATVIDCTLTNNFAAMNRRGKAAVSVHLAGGGVVSNWRAGTVSMAAGAAWHTGFPQTIPALASLVGTTTFELTIDDVTPPPYNQPPYPPSGDRDTDHCTVVGLAP